MSYILLIDDHAMFREPIKTVLEDAGHCVTAVEHGAAAIASLSNLTPDLVVLDLKMPGLSGEELLVKMRRQEALKRTPVIVLTTETGRRTVLRLARLGVTGYLSKTNLSLERLLTLVGQVLDPICGSLGERPAAIGVSSPRIEGLTPVSSVNHGTLPTESRQGVLGTRAMHDDSVESLRSLETIMRPDEVREVLAASTDLKGLSPMVAEVLSLTSEPRCTAVQVASVIESDPAMALRVLRLANTCVYSRGPRVDSVRRAIVHVGITGIRNAVLSLGVVERFSSAAFQAEINLAHFWEHSIACGVIAAEIARVTSPAEADAAFASGLLHDVGRLILAEQLGARYRRVVETARELQLPLDQVEVRMLSVSHADIMQSMLEKWHLPKEFAPPIVSHHASLGKPGSPGQRPPSDVVRLVLANRIAHALMLGTSGNETVSPTVEACQLLQLNGAIIGRIEAEARRKTRELRSAMLSHGDGMQRPDRNERFQTQCGQDVRALFVGQEPGLDAYRMLCAEVTAEARKGPPTIGVVHTTAVESPYIGDLLKAAEEAAGVHNLPLLVLSATGESHLERHILAGRVCLRMRVPVVVPRLCAAMTELSEGKVSEAA